MRNGPIFHDFSANRQGAVHTMNLTSITQSLVLAASGHGGGEASLVLPDLTRESFLGVSGHTLLLFGLVGSGAPPEPRVGTRVPAVGESVTERRDGCHHRAPRLTPRGAASSRSDVGVRGSG